jgi:hypothetical protein
MVGHSERAVGLSPTALFAIYVSSIALANELPTPS